jgi:hypothetical protein
MNIRGSWTGASGNGDSVLVGIANGEASASIPRGTPCILSNAGDGFSVVLPATAGAAKSNALAFGVATETMSVGQKSSAFAYGYSPYNIMRVATRAASTDSWTSSQSIASYALLGVDTVNNAFVTISASAGTGNWGVMGVLLQSIASIAASATNTSDTRTAITQAVTAFIRMM